MKKKPLYITNQITTFPISSYSHAVETFKPNRVVGKGARGTNWRYKFFLKAGFKCITCGIEANIIVVWYENRSNNIKSIHVDPFHYDPKQDRWVMMTVDHHIPRSKGGTSDYSNLRPMCGPCNHSKDNKLPEEFNRPNVDITTIGFYTIKCPDIPLHNFCEWS